MIKNRVSVIIPAWNSEDTIGKAIKSCLAQTTPPLEILVCDDGSTDKTKSVVKSFKSGLVRWIPGKSHSGRPAVPRNEGISQSRGEWLAFLDADDKWLPNKLKQQLSLLKKTKNLAVCANAIRSVNNSKRGNLLAWPKKQIIFRDLLRTNPVICSSAVVHRSLFAKALGFPEEENLKSVEDYALWLRIATLTNICYLPRPLVIYRDEPKKTIRGKVKQNDLNIKLKILGNFFSWLKNNYLFRP